MVESETSNNNTITDGGSTAPLYCWYHTEHRLYFEHKKYPTKIRPWKFGPKWALFGPPGAQKGPNTRSKWVVTMSPTQAGQWRAVGTKSGPPGPSEDFWSPRKDLFWPKRALFASFWSFSQTGWFYMGYNSAGWAEHSAAFMLWLPLIGRAMAHLHVNIVCLPAYKFWCNLYCKAVHVWHSLQHDNRIMVYA